MPRFIFRPAGTPLATLHLASSFHFSTGLTHSFGAVTQVHNSAIGFAFSNRRGFLRPTETAAFLQPATPGRELRLAAQTGFVFSRRNTNPKKSRELSPRYVRSNYPPPTASFFPEFTLPRTRIPRNRPNCHCAMPRPDPATSGLRAASSFRTVPQPRTKFQKIPRTVTSLHLIHPPTPERLRFPGLTLQRT
jgi:hypothetical protein